MSELEELQRLLFGVEKDRLETLNNRVERAESRAVDVADVLPEAVRLSHAKDGSLVRELRAPVTDCLEESFRTSPQQYADVLYPIMGPAIRRSIAHTFRVFTQQVNEMMEHSLSVRGMGWRWQAMRSGVPFGEYVIRQTLQYRVEQAYLISRENGLLVEHVHHESARIKDSDAVSAMFTAIQDFVKESFSPESNSRLETADMGEFTLWAVHGPHALLVCVIRGVPPTSLRAQLSAILERIHFRYGEALRTYIGETQSVKGVEVELTEAIQFQERQNPNQSTKKLWFSLAFVMLLIVLVVGYFGYVRWERQASINQLEASFADVPGVFLSDVSYEDGTFLLHGLRDPLAESPEKVVMDSGVDFEHLQMKFEPYRSFDSEIVFLRALDVISAPETVTISRSGEGIIISGSAPQDWIDAIKTMIQIKSIGLPVELENLQIEGLEELERLVREATGTEFSFTNGTELSNEGVVLLEQFSELLADITARAARYQKILDVSVAGYTDSAGSAELNAQLAVARAEKVRDQILSGGTNASQVTTNSFDENVILDSIGIENRKAVVSLSLRDQ